MMRRILLYIALGLAGIIAIGLMLPKPPQPPANARSNAPAGTPAAQETVASPPQKPDLELIDSKGTRTDISTEVTGRVRNNSGKSYRYVQVVFNLFNEQDEQVGTAMANTTGLAPGTVWRFRAVGLTPDGARFKLDKITGY